MTSNNLNLEIYEFIINDYSVSPVSTSKDKFYTTQIESITSDSCGYISKEDTPYTKKPITDLRRRSCDSIDGTIQNMESTVGDKQNLNIIDYERTMFFCLDEITSDDLIKFSHLFNTKEVLKKPTTIDEVTANIPNMTNLYNLAILNARLGDIETLLLTQRTKDNRGTETFIKVLRPTIDDKYIIIGDIHGSYATFIRILLRLRKMGAFDENCIFHPNYHIIFLGDIVDRGTYSFEIMMLIYMLKLKNPNNIHINRGNHEEQRTNAGEGFKAQMFALFGSEEIWLKINDIFKLSHSAMLIENPNLKTRYVYLAHGGYPLDTAGNIHPKFNVDSIASLDNIFIPEIEITKIANNIRWCDFYGKEITNHGNRGCY